MKEKELIEFCRYYKGEKESPSNDSALLWQYESKWVAMQLAHDVTLQEYVSDYCAVEKLNSFGLYDGVPISLKALLFNRFMHWNGGFGADIDLKNFKTFYASYLKG